MSLRSLQITNLRNIASASIECSSQFNLFFGDNAAGKTSVLEAIYYLGTGKSFRTHHHDRVVHHTENQLTLFATLCAEGSVIPVGIQRSRDGFLQIHIDEEIARSVAEISQQLPIQFIGSDSHRILSDGPKNRRAFLDWGLFHTNPLFFTQWKAFQKLLAQRNAALKGNASRDELSIWNNQFAAAGESLNVLRRAYVDDFTPFFDEISRVLLDDAKVFIQYLPGWDTESSLESCLNRNVSRETFVGHSLYGPQRADLILSVKGMPAQDALSQGQQKLVSYALRLAQGLHLQTATVKRPIYLIDDFPSELDPQKRTLATEILAGLRAQVFITGIEACDLQEILTLNEDNRMFHVKHGVITCTA